MDGNGRLEEIRTTFLESHSYDIVDGEWVNGADNRKIAEADDVRGSFLTLLSLSLVDDGYDLLVKAGDSNVVRGAYDVLEALNVSPEHGFDQEELEHIVHEIIA